MASGREAGVGGGVVEEAVPGEEENADLRAVQKAKASPKLSPRGSPASERGTVKTRRVCYCGRAAQHNTQMRQILSPVTHPNVSNYLTTDTPDLWTSGLCWGEPSDRRGIHRIMLSSA